MRWNVSSLKELRMPQAKSWQVDRDLTYNHKELNSANDRNELGRRP